MKSAGTIIISQQLGSRRHGEVITSEQEFLVTKNLQTGEMKSSEKMKI